MKHRHAALLIALAVVAASCADDADDGGGPRTATITPTTTDRVTSPTSTAPPTSSASPTSPTSPTIDSATAPSTSGAPRPEPVVGDPVVAGEPVVELDQPVDLAVRPGDDALWIVEQSGRVVRVAGTETAQALDIGDRVSTGSEQGLLGLEFSTDATTAYVDYTDATGDTVIAEFAVTADGVFDPASERTILTVPQPFANHNAGDLAIGPDGMLYVTLGDGGSGGDPERNGADPTTLLGSILRIDPTPTADATYTIPADNPFADGDGGAPEVWSWGLRNPWKIAFDPVTGELWIADVGQNDFEEVNVVAPIGEFAAGRAVDFGWSAFEGTTRFNDDVVDDGSSTLPVLTYSHADGCSISGGVPYRGQAIPELEPAYIYSDFCTGTIWALDLAGNRNLTMLGGFDGVTAIRSGPDDELYVLQRSGQVTRLVAG